MPPTTSGDEDIMSAALNQLAGGKLDFKKFAADIYKTSDPTKANVESARLRWKNFIKRMEKKTGTPIDATPKKDKMAGDIDGTPKTGTGKGRGRKRKVEENGEASDGEEKLMETPSKKKGSGRKAVVKVEGTGTGEENGEDYARELSAFEDAMYAADDTV